MWKAVGTQQLKVCLFNLQHLVEQMLSFPKPVLVELGVELVIYVTDVKLYKYRTLSPFFTLNSSFTVETKQVRCSAFESQISNS